MKLPFANKELGQHFLVNEKVISQITSDFAQQCEGIIEVGPGPAILTKHLATIGKPFHVVEMDERFRQYLAEYIDDNQIHFTDAMDVNFSNFIKEQELQTVWLVSNLPYNVGSPLMVKFAQVHEVKMMTLMMQKEVADRIYPNQEKKNYAGSLFALMQTYFEVKRLCHVAPGSFSPPPKVDSTVLSFKRNENPHVPLNEFKQFEIFLRRLFAQKRKQLVKVLSQHYPKDKVMKCLEDLNHPLTARSESLNLQDVQYLYKQIGQGASN